MITILTLIASFVGAWYLTKLDAENAPAFMLPCIFFCILFVVLVCTWTDQVERIESVKAQKLAITLNEERVQLLTQEAKRTLAELAPSHEKEMFEAMKPEQVSLFASAYPQLQANLSLMKYCDMITALSGEVQKMKTNVFDTEAEIRACSRNPFIPLNFLLPTE